MNAPTTLQELRSPAPREANMPAVTMGFGSLQSFELMQRAAKMLTHSTLVPVAYRAKTEVKEFGKVVGYEDNHNGLPNCVVALNMAQRMGADPLMVMQNLYIVEGRPSWSSQFIIAAINSCGRYSPLRFNLSEATEPEEVAYNATEWQDPPGGGKARKVTVQRKVTVRHQTCYAWAVEKETNERLQSPTISIQMAIDEGWLTKNGSKWQTMPEVMLRYRAAAFFGKLYAPELLMGLQTAEESTDIIDINPDGSYTVASTSVDELRGRARPADVVQQGAADPMNPQPGWQDGAYDAEREPAQPVRKQAAAPSTEGEKQESQARQPAGNELPLDHGLQEGQPGASADEPPLTFNEVKTELLTAGTVEDLDYARSLIKQIPDEEAKATLNSIAARRMSELTKKDEPAAIAQPARRARVPINAD
ncbi:hypothetical protein RA280_15175 [Cupriavidus sp. CV2]|uniref:hypothetical protein n=1 Tax=Cupriavidus ulmosensis TaxID=3065913 RepID=UPI00296B0102|nr:hypothetical protein [Cupriavidus sp. CV2]MDW3683066.1 hypothetical protein [Cupriavidus sp. CV2]